MNIAIYRAGHLQNVITIDQNMLESVKIMYALSSTLHGSDALGGAVILRYAAYHYGTQRRQLAGYELNIAKASFFDQLLKIYWIETIATFPQVFRLLAAAL